MVSKSNKTPITNRGVDNTLNIKNVLIYQGFENTLEQFILFDWFQATIFIPNFDTVGDLKYYATDLFFKLFGLSSSDLCFEYKGLNGYNASLYYKNIYIMYNTFRSDMGLHIKMSGQGCRDFEQLGLDYFDFFRKLMKYDLNFNRIDISIDDFSNRYFDISKLNHYIQHKSVSSKFISCMNVSKTRLSDSSLLGNTLQFGSKASDIQVTFYDKLKERQSQNIIVSSNIKHWIRTELRFRHEKARGVVNQILIDDNNVNKIVKGILRDYISFKDIFSKDSNVSRREEASWWVQYLENIDYLKLTNYLPENSITRKENWIKESTSKSNFIVYLSKLNNLKLDDHVLDYMYDLFKCGSDKFSFNDLKIINDYRINNHLEPFTMQEIKDYIEDLNIVASLPF